MENIIIIGAGPAGISAALYAARGNMDPLIINTGIGSLEKAEKIENYYGLEQPLSGRELFERGLAQARALGVRILDAQVVGMGGFDTFEVKTTAGDFEARSVILATGSRRASARIPGVKEFEGKGVSYCAVCDAFFYRGKEVAVLGNSDLRLWHLELWNGYRTWSQNFLSVRHLETAFGALWQVWQENGNGSRISVFMSRFRLSWDFMRKIKSGG